MKRACYILVITMIVFYAANGCGGHCIEVAGGYKGVDGTVKYCFGQGESDAAGVPVFSVNAGGLSGIGEKIYGFTKKQVEKIKDKLRGLKEKYLGAEPGELAKVAGEGAKEGLTTGTTSAAMEKHPVREILEILKEK